MMAVEHAVPVLGGLGAPAPSAVAANAGAEPPQRSDSVEMPQFGATFYPGGFDDYYMPQDLEVVAPAPQRVMPEVPQNMQQDLQRMELQANSPPASAAAAGAAPPPGREAPVSTTVNTKVGEYGQQYQQTKPGQEYSPASGYSSSVYSPLQDNNANGSSPLWEKKTKEMREQPSFSVFPSVKGDHIPPSDSEKEGVLAESRTHVLHSNDPNMQICWARDVLSFVEIAAEAATREAEALRSSSDRDIARPATPKIEHDLRVDALNIVKYLADQSHPEAVFIRSKWLEFGKFGNRTDTKAAYAGYVESAQAGWTRSEYRIGMLFENSNDMDRALQHYSTGLAHKDSAASYRMGMISLLGQHGQRRDLPRGLELIRAAADGADEDAPQGAFVYGMLIAKDLPDVAIPDGVLSNDVNEARQYIEKAAYLGFAKAQLKMGQAYELCQLGCDFSPAHSLHYYGLAARQGQPEACLGVSRWFLFGFEGTFAKNEQLAFKYAQLAAKSKLPTGEFAMGYYYEIGIHVEKDLREARKWYELAAEHGNKDALGRIDGLTQSKTLTKQDHETTTLTRIKSQHGSQRGKRPERFKQNPMPALAEGESPRVSPQPSPRQRPQDEANVSDPGRSNGATGASRPPAFGINLPERPKSAAPYPEDDKPPPLNLGRPKSTAPYPEDDVVRRQPQLSPHYNPNIGPSADRPGSAFGIRPQAGPGQPAAGRPNLAIPPAGTDASRIRPVSASAGFQPLPQSPASGYRQASGAQAGRGYEQRPASASYDGRQPGYDQRLGTGAGPSPINPAQKRLTKNNPNPYPASQPPPGQYPQGNYGPSGGAPPPAAGNPGREYGPRTSSIGYQSGRGSAAPSVNSPVMSGGAGPPRKDSLAHSKLPSQGGGGGGAHGAARPPGVPMKDYGAPGGRRTDSAPPGQQSRPNQPSPAPSAGSVASAPPKPSKGPATFEQMGIPQGKHDDDCVIM